MPWSKTNDLQLDLLDGTVVTAIAVGLSGKQRADRVAALLASNQPVTRDAVAGMRDASASVPVARDASPICWTVRHSAPCRMTTGRRSAL